MKKTLLNPAQIITVNTNGLNQKRNTSMGDIEVLTGHSIIIEEDVIKDIVPDSSLKNPAEYIVIDLKNRIVLPGLIDCHTHTAFAGSRSGEFRLLFQGTSYEEIARAGGGINTTVKAVRNSTFEELVFIIIPRINYFISRGITSLEIKSGYGLDFENEIKLLQVIRYLDEIFPIDIIPTFLGAHTYPAEYKDNHLNYISLITGKMIPHISKNKLARFCDGFCEVTAFSPAEIEQIFKAAQDAGLGLKLHTEQFHRTGGLETALKYKAVSADHLEVIEPSSVKVFDNCDTAAVLLPGVSFFLNYEYAPARDLIDNNVITALATDYNPGTSPVADLNFIMSLGVLKMKMSVEETICAVTINAAKALNINHNRGSIEIGKKADFAVFNTTDYSDIVYNIGKNLNIMTIKNGNIIYSKHTPEPGIPLREI